MKYDVDFVLKGDDEERQEFRTVEVNSETIKSVKDAKMMSNEQIAVDLAIRDLLNDFSFKAGSVIEIKAVKRV